MTATDRPHFGPGDALPDGARQFRKTTITTMVQMTTDFTCTNREGHDLEGKASDWLVPDGHGGFYPVSAEFHAANYAPAAPAPSGEPVAETSKDQLEKVEQGKWGRIWRATPGDTPTIKLYLAPPPPSPEPGIALETTAEDRAAWCKRANDAGRLARDFARCANDAGKIEAWLRDPDSSVIGHFARNHLADAIARRDFDDKEGGR